MDKSREQRDNLVYKLWLDSDTLYQWSDPKQSRLYVQKAIERVDAPNLLRLAVYTRTHNGLTPIANKGAMGAENILRVLDELAND